MTDPPEVVATYGHRIGENPLWLTGEARLYWCDIYEGRLYRYDPATGDHERVYDGDRIGGFTFEADGSLLLFQDEGAIRRWQGGNGIVEAVVEPGEVHGQRFNDVIADPEGRVFCGTYAQEDDPIAALYRLDTDGTLTELRGGLALSNGLGFSPDDTTLYHTESYAGRIYEYDYDAATGALGDRSVFVDVDTEGGIPDGMTVDSAGDVWSAMAGCGCVVFYAPDGSERSRLAVPTELVTSLTFGGSRFDDVYVTTGGGDDPATYGPEAGTVYRFPSEGSGRAEHRSRICSD
jgi:D-xylonolactonase